MNESIKEIYSLRRNGELDEAYSLALSVYQDDADDDDVKKAFSWVLIDLCKERVSEQDFNQAQIYFNQLSDFEFDYEDDFIETIRKQIRFLEPKIDPHYDKIQQAEELSKSGQEQQAIDMIRVLNADNQLSVYNHETYGWIMYRYLKVQKENLPSANIQSFLCDYLNLLNKRPSLLHSMMLNFAINYSKQHADFNFNNFFIQWNLYCFMDGDWEEEKGKDGATYKPLAIRAIKKSFEAIKNQPDRSNTDLSWLINIYNKAIELFPGDEWLIREKALLFIRQKDFDSASKIYRKLVIELGDKYYIWQEFADCVASDNQLKIGMLAKALSLEKNEDFLGDIHLMLAKALNEQGLLENATIELNTYKTHRDNKGWRLSPEFDALYKSVNAASLRIKDNDSLYEKFIPLAENFAYQDIDWIEVVLIDRWVNDEKKERLNLSNGKDCEFSTGINRFPILKKTKIGEVYKAKCFRQVLREKTVETQFRWTVITEYKFTPLLIENAKKEAWSILPHKYGFIDYINPENKSLRILTDEINPVFYRIDREQFSRGQYVEFRQYFKTIKEEKCYFAADVKNCDREIAIENFKNKIVVVDDINESKKLFHYVLGRNLLTGIAFFEDTAIRPAIGEFLKVYYCVKKEKDGKKKLVTLSVEKTDEQNKELIRTVSGRLELKYKKGYDIREPDFAFIDDFYVSKKILQQYQITADCHVTAQAVYTGDNDKWKVYKIESQNINK